ncbi:discoidin domain-containing protein [Hymenobacter sp. HSC-4F20]|uniref:discoidin domain-containing protein n=1 Tax=Hymenobacter sp. HSC-4F20 TaxID=2864135 RepID=UPI001C72AE99|nr:discoidin domain-containing protein [Hymenobacter sp. HSC-4F20]MBX0293216.1 discoidin domain-containing protein [Hymenobacter sp. HSC-4F20]
MTRRTTYYCTQPPLAPPAAQLAPVNRVRYYPRPGFATRTPGTLVQGSPDRQSWTTLHTITATPAENQFTEAVFANSLAFRYIRLLMPAGGYGNFTEIEFYHDATRLVGTPFGSSGSYLNYGNTFEKVFDGDVTTFFDAPDSNPTEMGLELLATSAAPGDFSAADFSAADFYVSA